MIYALNKEYNAANNKTAVRYCSLFQHSTTVGQAWRKCNFRLKYISPVLILDVQTQVNSEDGSRLAHSLPRSRL